MSFRGAAILIGLLLLFGGIIAAIIAGTGGSKKQEGQASKGPDKGSDKSGDGGSGGDTGVSKEKNPTFLEEVGAERTVEARPMIKQTASWLRANKTNIVRQEAKNRREKLGGDRHTIKSASELLAIHTLYKLGYLEDEETAKQIGKDIVPMFGQWWPYWRDKTYFADREYNEWIKADPNQNRII